jgi:hypothetical protein
MTYYPGKKSYVGLAIQDTAGTAETVPVIYLPVEDFPDIKSSPANYYSKEFRNVNAEITKVYRKPTLSSSGSINMAAYNNFVTYAMYGVMGTNAASGDAEGYTHAMKVNHTTLPIWTVFTGTADLAMEKFHDMTMKSISFSAAAGETIKVGVEMEGASGDIITAAATPTYTALRPLNYADVSVSLGGSPNCEIDALDIQINRNVQMNRVLCTSGLTAWEPNKAYPTTIDVSGSFTMYFDGYTEYKYWLGKSDATAMATDTYEQDDADRALVITMTGEEIKSGGAATKDSIVITVPKIVYDDAQKEITYDDLLKVTFNWKAVHDVTSETSVPGTGTVSATIVSEVADPAA